MSAIHMIEDDLSPEEARIQELEREVYKLRRINKALMDRVERSMDFQGNAFSLFQTAIVLETKVKERTQQLEETLRELEVSNAALGAAKEAAEKAQLRLQEAIEAVNEGFALFDRDDRLVMCNRTYLKLWPSIAEYIKPGLSFGEIAGLAASSKSVLQARSAPERWVAERLSFHASASGSHVHPLSDGRWIQINERRTAEGGTVGIYTDITDVKEHDARERAQVLAEKSALLQATLDNIPQGVSVYDRDLRLVAWNGPFVRLLELPEDVVHAGATYHDFLRHNASLGAQGFPAEVVDLSDGAGSLTVEQAWHNGRVLELRRNPMPGGGFVTTYTDMTERKRIEQALRDGEQRIRLITDTIPALIAYVDAGETYRFVNRRYRDLFGRDDIVGLTMRELLGKKAYDWREPHIRTVMSGKETEFELGWPGQGGGKRYGHATYVPHFGPDGIVIGFFSLIQDVTERRRAAEALKEANEGLERRVADRTAALTEVNTQLHQEIRERLAMEEALRVAKTTAEQANLSKTKFLAAASHDLLQPLNAARLFVSALTDADLPPEPKTLIEKTDSALLSVEDLLEALLDISKLDAGAVSAQPDDFPISALLGALAAEYAPVAKERGLDLRFVSSGVVVRSDMRLLRRILQNFISNALRYTRSGRVLVGCRRMAGQLRLEVVDTGPGIPEDKLTEIFEEFRRLETDRHIRDRGMGLGLAIVQRVARMLNHPVEVTSTLGRGSTFSVTVPLGGTATAKCRPLAKPAVPYSPLTGARVLVIDNEAAILDGMSALLRGWGCEVTVAMSGEEAVARLRDLGGRPEVVVADYHLEEGALGVMEIQRVRQACGHKVPGIVITANRTADVHDEVQAHGLPLLTKPVKPAQLRALITQLLS
ncbi:NahK/ErcS family hybrid sensor histidine kinase/response regulator [Indioceanicola profundi]|uniref:NahK/ErcS family hybrid sensor histidine kinase/response regulator n=1 Tax=Indioceanicola profundi TaxID=2220096 RepID=UPI000E6AC103|nr:NahK/ErcS family hybrid sensor histidine kinase/response regulator [Indioceanicola profundi]